MPLIKDGAEAENTWTYIEDEAVIGDAGSVTVSLSRYLDENEALSQRNAAVGVRLTPADDPHLLEPYLEKLDLIEVSFPKYTDGRGYSQAQLLRRRLGYSGELRAVDHVLTDQILYMHRSGFDSFFTSRANLSSVLKALSEYSEVYQLGADNRKPVFAKRQG